MDEEAFMSAFEDVKRINLTSKKQLSDELTRCKDVLSKSSNDWKIRIDAMQTLRALVMAGANKHEEMQMALRTLDVPFQVSVKDLRSQVSNKDSITEVLNALIAKFIYINCCKNY